MLYFNTTNIFWEEYLAVIKNYLEFQFPFRPILSYHLPFWPYPFVSNTIIAGSLCLETYWPC